MSTVTRSSSKSRRSSRHNGRSRSMGSLILGQYSPQTSLHESEDLKILQLSKTFSDEPMQYFRKYLNAQVQQPREFVVMRQAPKAASFTSSKLSSCSYIQSESALKISQESGEKVIPANTIEKVEWGFVEGKSEKTKYINIVLKGDRSPLVIHGASESMDLLFEALRLISNDQPITATAGAKLSVIKKAIEIAKMDLNQNIDIPPPPANFNFVTSLS